LPQHQIPHRAAADTGDRRQKQKTDNVELLARGGQRAGRGKHGDAGEIKGEDGVHGGEW
jgi:hypothetical protein